MKKMTFEKFELKACLSPFKYLRSNWYPILVMAISKKDIYRK